MNIDRKELLAALEPLKPALGVRSKVTELSHIWFDGKFVYAHDGGMGIRVAFESSLKLGLPGTLLLGLVDKTSGDSLTLEVEGAALSLKVGRSNVKLATMPIDRQVWPYPEKPDGKAVASLKVSEDFIKALKRVFVLKASSPKRMEHYSVCVFAIEKEMDIYTTDSNFIALMPVSETITGKVDSLAIPRSFAEQMVSNCEAGVDLKMYSDHFHCAATDKITLYSNVFDTSAMLDLPKFADKFLDEKLAPPFPIPDDLSAALDRAVLLAGPEKPVVTLKTSGKAMSLSGEYAGRGELDEEFTLTKSMPKCSIDVIASVFLSLKDIDRMMVAPGAITLRGKDGFVYVLAGYGRETPKAERKSRD